MQRLGLATAMAVFCAAGAQAQLNGVSTSGSLGWESADVFRGGRLAEGVFVAKLDADAPAAGGLVYAGVEARLPTRGDNGDFEFPNRVDLYGGFATDITETIGIDLGLTAYTSPFDDNQFLQAGDDRIEAFAGLTFDTVFAPAVYLYLDPDREDAALEGNANFERLIAPATSIDVGGAAGLVATGADGEDDYAYLTLTADLRFDAPRSGWSFNAGARWSGSTEDRYFTDTAAGTGAPTDFEGDLFWGGVGVNFRR